MPMHRSVNKNFFKIWTPEMAYVLGFFAADGYITRNNRGANFWCIQITDKELLYAIRKIIGSDHAISVRERSGNEKTSYRLQIGSKEMCEDLRALGFAERKTKSLCVPNIPDKFFGAFVRGYFDGDGNVWVGENHKASRPVLAIQTIFTSCSLEFLSSIKERLLALGVMKGGIFSDPRGYHRLHYSIRDSWQIYKIMYTDSAYLKNGLFLDRKKEIFDKYIIMRP